MVKKFSIFATILLCFQLVFPLINAFAFELLTPTNLKSSQTYPGNIILSWDKVSGASAYRVYKLDAGKQELVKQVTYEFTETTIFGVQEGSSTFAVSAVRNLDETPLSNSVTVEVSYPKMQSPTSISSTILNGNDLTLSWNKATYATDYKIYQVIDGTRKLVTTTTAVNYTFQNHPEGKYVYEVTSYNSRFGESNVGLRIEVDVIYPIMTSPLVTYTVQNGNDLIFNWQRVNYASNYKVYEVIDGTKKLLTTTRLNSHIISNVTEGKHVYEVTAFSDRFGESKEPFQLDFDMVYPKMQAPGSLTYALSNLNDINLRWAKVEYADKYKLYQYVNGERKLLLTTSALNSIFVNMPEGNYKYELASYSDRFGESSSVANVEFDLTHPVIEAPKNLNITVQNGNDLVLRWDPSDYATGYKVYQIINGERKLITNKLVNAHTLLKMPEGHYTFEVIAYSDRFGESKTASTVEYDLKYPELKAPVLTGTVENESIIILDWTKQDNVTGYNIYEIVNGTKKMVATTTSLQQKLSNQTEGKHIYEVTSYNTRFGESQASNQVTLNIGSDIEVPPVKDTIPPVTISNIADSYYKEDVTVQLTATDNQSGVAKTFYSINDSTFKEGTTFTIQDEGKHKVSFYSVDNAGNIEITKTVEVKIDKTAPNTTSNATNSWFKEDFFNLSSSDNVSGVAKTFYSINGSDFVEGTSFKVKEEGVTKVSFYSIDKVGNIEEVKTVEVNIDNIKPITTSNLTNSWYKEDVNVLLSPSDHGSGIDKTFYTINGYDLVEGTSFRVSNEGVTKVSFNSIDKAGNIEDVNTVEVKIDKTAPITTSNVKNSWYKANVNVLLSPTDHGSGVDKTYYSINGSDFVEGTSFSISEEGVTKVSFYSVDKAGNIEEVNTVEVNIDKTAPITTSNLTNEDGTVLLSPSDNGSGVDKTYYSINGSDYKEGKSFRVSEKGVTKFSFYSIDKAGNIEDVNTVEVNIDKTAPITTSNVKNSWYKEDVTVLLSATDDESGVDKTYYSINGPDFVEGTSFSVSEEGVTKVSFYSVDKAGNIEEVNTVEVNIDKTAPITTSNLTNEDGTVLLSPLDNKSGVDKTYYSINGSDYKEGTSFKVSEDGVTKVSFYSVDKAGNIEDVNSVEVNIDKTAPITTSNVKNSWYKEDVTVFLSPTDSGSGVDKTYYTINGYDLVEGTSFRVNNEGVTKVSFNSIDKAGNIEDVNTVEVKIDKTAPITTSNVKNSWYKDDVTVLLSPSDNGSGVDKTYYSINGSDFVEGTSFSVSEEGVTKVSFYSIDKAGNIEEVKNVEVNIDKTAPITISNLTNEDGTVLLSPSDNESGVDKTYYSINGSDYKEGISFKLSEDGVTKVSFYSVDKAGNIEDVNTVEVNIDKTAPITTSNVKNSWYKEDVTVLLSPTDNGSGVDKTYYSINGSDYKEGTSFKVSEEGVKNVSFYSVDMAGNIEDKKTVDVKIDKNAPIVVWNLKDEYALGTYLPGYSAIDTVSGIDSEKVTVNGQEITGPIKFDKPGSYTVVLTVTDKAGWTTIVKKTISVYVQATIVVNPGIIKTNTGVFTVQVTVPKGLDMKQFDLHSATLNGVSANSGTNGLLQQAKNGQFKFDRDQFTWKPGTVEVEFRGFIDGYLVVGSTTVIVK
ncbi:OmpL47-type beta-barrel domain-containing protein [Bacillus salipaludis]|uniref:OmpL47-type beta-barrel domain-containing protein n=1 Tax=Bacillus salipaludis TaxID=2547811 RepID=A0ABW8RAU8_9BACI